ncbi:hypothetical protein Tco_0902719 [Tanacetum coccineum]
MSVNRTTGKSPFEVVYGWNPISPLDLVPVPEVGGLVKNGLTSLSRLKSCIGRFKNRLPGIMNNTMNMRISVINDNAYKIELRGHYIDSTTFNVADLSPYKGDSDDEPDSGLSIFQEGEDDADAVNERVNVTNMLGAYFSAINFGGGLG